MSGKDDIVEIFCLFGNRNIFVGLVFLVIGVGRDKNEFDELDSELERIEFNCDYFKC